MKVRASALAALLFLASVPPVAGQGHGPIFGLSTPTLGQGGWSLDVGAMGRVLTGRRMVMLRPMLGYGLTEDLQLTASVPVSLARDPGIPPMRGFTRMPATRDVEVGVGWRLQRRGLGVGARQETTLWLAVDQPLDDARGAVSATPGVFGALVTGYASRSVYLWAGGAHRRFASSGGKRPGDQTMASLVVGYRPPFLRHDYPNPDWRGFLEVVGEWAGPDRMAGQDAPDTGGRQIVLALTALGLYGSWGIAAGPGFPVVDEMNGAQPGERVRFAVNVTFWW